MDLDKFQGDLVFSELVASYNIRRNLTIGMRYNTGLCEDLIWYIDLQNKDFDTNKQLLLLYYVWIKSLGIKIKMLIKTAKKEVDINIQNQKLEQIIRLTNILKDLVTKYG